MKIKIDGTEYELIDISTIDLDESVWFYELAGEGIENLEAMEDFKPGLVKGLLCLSVARAKPEVSKREIEQVVGSMKITDLGDAFEKAVAESPPDESPVRKTEGEPPPSGNGSNGDGDTSPDDAPPSATGSPDLDTGFLSFHGTSAG